MANLDFHPFQDGFSINSTNDQSFSGSIGDRDKNMLVNDADTATSGTRRNFLTFAFYQQYFDVDTDQVVKRVINSVIPTQNNFILDFVQPIPDLWGPFWVCVTLVFSIGIFGNIAQYIESEGTTTAGSDFTLVTSASTLIFCYVVFVPMAIFGILWNRRSDLQYPYLDLLCAYGYSLAVFIPVSVLWVLDVDWFRWVLIFAAVSLSGGVLAKAIYPAFKNDSNKLIAFGSIAGVLILHFLLAFTFKVYFFDAVHPTRTVLSPIGGAASQVSDNVTLPASVAAAVAPAASVSTPENKLPSVNGELPPASVNEKKDDKKDVDPTEAVKKPDEKEATKDKVTSDAVKEVPEATKTVADAVPTGEADNSTIV